MRVLKNACIYLIDFALLVKAEVKRDLLYMKRYPLEIISFLFFMFVILLAIIFGMNTLLPKGSGVMEQGDAVRMIIGYCLMQFVLATQMGWSGQIQNESQTGTLEQLSISGHSLGGVLFARGIAQLPRQILSFFLMVGAYKISIQPKELDLSHFYVSIVDLCILAIGIFGVSYLFAGITLLFKRVGFFFQIINFGFLGLFWLKRPEPCAISGDACQPVLSWLFDHFPLTIGMTELTESLTTPSVARMSPYSMVTFVAYSLIFILLGYASFRWMERRARAHGLLSQY